MICPKIKQKNIILLIFSLIFYAWGEPVYILLMSATVGVAFFTAKLIEKHRDTQKAKLYLILTILFDLGILGLFKYTPLIYQTLNDLTPFEWVIPEIVMPIGISFYTFQILTYTIDVYRKQVPVQKSYYKLLMYVSLFPQLIAGPIVRYSDIETQIEKRSVSMEIFSLGIQRFSVGLGKKVIIANMCAKAVNAVFESNIATTTVVSVWLGIIMFTLQIYFDFSGYSDMAIGLGLMFGFEFKENFIYPYKAKSVTDFWRCWHVSMSSFFRDYIYIPLGGNRKNWLRNVFIVWFLTGLWHGASWNFVFWGLFYAVLLISEKKFLMNFFDKLPKFLSNIMSVLYMFIITSIGWTIFYFTDFSRMFDILKTMFFIKKVPINDFYAASLLSDNAILLIVAIPIAVGIIPIICKLMEKCFKDNFEKIRLFYMPFQTAFLLIVSSILLVGNTYNPFLYFRF